MKMYRKSEVHLS